MEIALLSCISLCRAFLSALALSCGSIWWGCSCRSPLAHTLTWGMSTSYAEGTDLFSKYVQQVLMTGG